MQDVADTNCDSVGYWLLQNSAELVSQVLETLLKISVLIGLVFITFGYSYSFLLLSIYGGPVLTDGSGWLYCCFHCSWFVLPVFLFVGTVYRVR